MGTADLTHQLRLSGTGARDYLVPSEEDGM
jgi:hypothetical protein